jgi:hypothetical protein
MDVVVTKEQSAEEICLIEDKEERLTRIASLYAKAHSLQKLLQDVLTRSFGPNPTEWQHHEDYDDLKERILRVWIKENHEDKEYLFKEENAGTLTSEEKITRSQLRRKAMNAFSTPVNRIKQQYLKDHQVMKDMLLSTALEESSAENQVAVEEDGVLREAMSVLFTQLASNNIQFTINKVQPDGNCVLSAVESVDELSVFQRSAIVDQIKFRGSNELKEEYERLINLNRDGRLTNEEEKRLNDIKDGTAENSLVDEAGIYSKDGICLNESGIAAIADLRQAELVVVHLYVTGEQPCVSVFTPTPLPSGMKPVGNGKPVTVVLEMRRIRTPHYNGMTIKSGAVKNVLPLIQKVNDLFHCFILKYIIITIYNCLIIRLRIQSMT